MLGEIVILLGLATATMFAMILDTLICRTRKW
jgi:hypothetical protein